jgi:sugar lactone lactonase YvrE
VYTGARIPALHGRYVFGDFLSGRVWALELPAAPGAPAAGPAALGRWQVLISSFARDADGELYLLDFQGGAVHRIVPAPGPPAG